MEIRIMSEGETILGAIRQLRELHRNVSLLLKTADSAMTEKGWVNAKSDATALHEMSYSINSPDQWMPWEVFRYYKHKDHPTLRSEEHTSELQSLMRISYAVFCLTKKLQYN